MIRRSLVLMLAVFASLSIQAQRKCVTNLSGHFAEHEIKEKLQNLISEQRRSRSARVQSEEEENVYTIPVVFHVIYNNEIENIPDEQIYAQMESLNQDFRRLNADTTDTPLDFLPVATDTKIQFELAKRDPEGNPTTGIVRVPANQSSYDIESFSDRFSISSLSHWDTHRYLNISVGNFTNQVLGYASFPVTDLEGIGSLGEENELLDGVFIFYQFLGRGFNSSIHSRGRTLTHEIGHFLGLLHTFEGFSSSCNGGNGDYCDDTPNMTNDTPFTLRSCDVDDADNFCDESEPKMIQNFLDYSPDACMNLFTVCQKERMRTVLETNARRRTLLFSPAIHEPNDLGIKRVISPLNAACESQYTPSVEIRNFGTNDISSVDIDLFVNGELVDNFSGTVDLPAGISSTIVNFEDQAVQNGLQSTFTFRINATNGVSDGEVEDNESSTVTCGLNGLFSVLPNIVTSGAFRLNVNSTLTDDLTIRLVNSRGLVAYEETFSVTNGSYNPEIITSGLVNGVYIVYGNSGGSFNVQKLVINQ